MERSGAIREEELLAHMGWVRALARHLLSDPGLAEDVAQETWLAANERPPRAREGAGLKAWLASVTRTLARQTVRSRIRRTSRERMVARPEAIGPEPGIVERGAMQERVVRAVMELDEPYRSTVLLRYLDGHSAAQIGARSGESPALVRKRLERALTRLRARLDAQFGGDRRAWLLGLAMLAGRDIPKTAVAIALKPTAIVVGVAGILGALVYVTSRLTTAEVHPTSAIAAPVQDESIRPRDAPRSPIRLDSAERTGLPPKVAAKGGESRTAIVDELAARLDAIADSFRTDRPDIDGLAALLDELGRSASVLPDSLVCDHATITAGSFTFPGTSIVADLERNQDQEGISLRAPTARPLDPPFFLRDVALVFGRSGTSGSSSIRVQFHPLSRPPADSFLAEGEEKLVGWVSVYEDAGSSVQPLTMRRGGDAGEWRLGHSEVIPIDERPGTPPPICVETWRRALENACR